MAGRKGRTQTLREAVIGIEGTVAGHAEMGSNVPVGGIGGMAEQAAALRKALDATPLLSLKEQEAVLRLLVRETAFTAVDPLLDSARRKLKAAAEARR